MKPTPIKNKKSNKSVWVAGCIYFIVIPLILVIVFLRSDNLKQLLILYPSAPTFLSLIGSNYFHITFSHLIENLVLYLLLMVFVFSFDAMTNKKMLFLNMVLLLVLLPIFSSLVDCIAFSIIGVNIPGFGFSAVVAGVFGYLAFSTLHYIKQYHELRFERSIFQLMWTIFYINAVLILLVYKYYLAAVVVFVLLVLSFYYTYRDFNKILVLTKNVNRLHRTLILGGLILCICFVSQALFPETLKYNGTIINILAHYFGYTFGFIVPAIVSTYFVKKRKSDL